MRFLWEAYHDVHFFNYVPEDGWIDEIFFCLLGGFGISFEMNLSAFNVLKEKGYLEPCHYTDNSLDKLQALIELELRTPQFLPLRRSGACRLYRFYGTKARLMIQAGTWLHESCSFDLTSILESDPRRNRRRLMECPGFGFKTASWFLRNIGRGERLAILDVHIVRTLREFGIIPSTLSPSAHYLEIEDVFLEACDRIGAKSEHMDLILWNWARGDIYGRRISD